LFDGSVPFIPAVGRLDFLSSISLLGIRIWHVEVNTELKKY
jgi:hypothetical protein